MTSADRQYHEIKVPRLLNEAAISELQRQLNDCEDGSGFLVLKGEDGVYCEGMDLGWISSKEPSELDGPMAAFTAVLEAITKSGAITIGLVNGSVTGGGMGIVCACDHVIAAETSCFMLPEAQLGLVPGIILPYLLKRMSPADVRKMVYTARRHAAHEALNMGIVDTIAPDEQSARVLQDAVDSMRHCKPGTVRDLRKLMQLEGIPNPERSRLGADLLKRTLEDNATRERLQAIASYLEH